MLCSPPPAPQTQEDPQTLPKHPPGSSGARPGVTSSPPAAGPGEPLPRGARVNFCRGVCGEPLEPLSAAPPLRSPGCGARWTSKREKVVWHVTRPRGTVHLGTICTPPAPAIHPRTHPLTKRLSNHHLLWQPAGINAIKRVFNGLIDWSRYRV